MAEGINRAKALELASDLDRAALGRWLDALKGGAGAVRLQHVMALKEQARRGPAALEEALAAAGVDVSDDRRRLAVFLRERLEAQGGLSLKSPGAPGGADASSAWRSGLTDETGALPEEVGRQLDDRELDDDAPTEGEAGEVWPPGMKIVNGHLAHSIRAQGMIQAPNRYGYIHLAGELERPRPLRKPGARKAALLEELKRLASALREAEPEVRRADVLSAFVIPPGSKEGRRVLEQGRYDVHVAEFDVVVLVECESVEAAARVRLGAPFAELERALASEASFLHCITARSPKRIAEVDKDRPGVFLFNYFFAADIAAKGAEGVDILLAVWEYTAGWWTAKANLTNSTPLQPIEGERSEYSLINHCRWDSLRDVLPHLIFRPSLDKFVLANFTANDIMAMPILYHLA